MEITKATLQSFLDQYNAIKGTSYSKIDDRRTDLITRAINKDPAKWESGEMVKEIASFELGLHRSITAYLRDEKAAEVKASEETKPTEETKMEQTVNNQNLGNTLGLLEQAVAQVIINNRGEEIKNAIIGDFEKKAQQFMFENYGPVTKKVTLEMPERKVEFDEVLHEKFETILKFVEMNEPVFLTGRAGTGKNVICKQIAKAMNLDFYFTNAVTQEYKLTGFIDANGTYHETQFYKAFKNGGLFMLDEMDASIPEVLIILNAAIANRYFDFPNGYCEAHPDFRIIAAGNTFGLGADYEYCGRNQLDMASLDRFAMVEVDYDKQIELNVAEGDSELVSFVEELRKTANGNGTRMVISYRSIGRIARMQKLMELSEVLKTCLFKGMGNDDINTLVCSMDSGNKYVKASKELTR